ncbi:glycerophosphodiester phosphodiesterase [Actinophytocola sp. KF-1]
MARTPGILALTAVLVAVGSGLAPQAAADVRPDLTNVAHRGASAHAPENTLAAMRLGVAMDADMVEIDVQRTADGGIVLMHDTTLIRTTDAEVLFPGRPSYDVSAFTLAEIRQLDAGEWFGPEFDGEKVPTLAEALAVLRGGDVGLLLEIKEPARYPGIEKQVARHLDRWWRTPAPPGLAHRLVIQSFDWASMKRSHDLLPRIPHGLLGRVPEAEIAGHARWADQINPGFATVDAAYVRAVHDAGLEIYVYTVNTAADMLAQIDKGVDGIITNYPDVLAGIIAGDGRAAA